VSTQPFSHLTGLRCSATGRHYDSDQLLNVSEAGATLLADYDLERIRSTVPRAALAGREPTLWRYHELLPVRDAAHVRTLGEGFTPLTPLPTLGARLGVPHLMVKDESSLPTGSFKARGAAVGAARAAELGVTELALPTNGNAGAAWATYCARQGIKATVVMPVDAPRVTRVETHLAGADLVLIDGLISDAGRAVGEYVGRTDAFDASTLKEPYRVEGKKTMGLEIVEQLAWQVPDVIVYPTGGGVGIIGIHKALQELAALGWIDPDRMPRLVCVQAAGCDPVVRAFRAGEPVTALTDTSTVAFGINVPAPLLGGPLVLDAIRKTDGTAVAVDDDELLSAMALCSSLEGLLFCPEGAATISAVARLRESGWLSGDEVVVTLNTGAGNKYPDATELDLPVIPRDGLVPVRD
jgi:threonine synthase